jgi:lysozyme
MTRALILLALCLTLAACGAPRRGGDALSPVSSAPVSPARFGDADPHPWEGRAPSAYPVHGIDLSRWQPPVDWPRARTAGVSFAFVKATEGGDALDPAFRDHWRGARAAGIPTGAYHFFYHCRPAAEQATWFIAHVPRVQGALPPVLDMEWTPLSPTCTRRRAPEVIRAEARVFLDALERHYWQRPILYTTPEFFETNAMWRLEGVEFWLRSTAAHPRERYAGQHWTFWQYSGTGLVPGVRGRIDLNVFAGGVGDWQAWLAARTR